MSQATPLLCGVAPFSPAMLGLSWYALFTAPYLTLLNRDVNQSANTLTIAGTRGLLTKTGASFVSGDYNGCEIIVSGAANAANNGNFVIDFVSATVLGYQNPVAVVENPFLGTYSTGGKCSQFVTADANAYPFVQTLNTARFCGDTINWPGHTVLRRATLPAATRSMTRADATLAGALNGNTTFTMFAYLKALTLSGQAAQIQYNDGTANNQVQWRQNANYTSGMNLSRTQGGATVNESVLYNSDTAARLYSCIYSSAGTHEEFYDGVSQGVVAATTKAPAGMNLITLGVTGGETIFGGMGVKAGTLAASQMVQLKNWYQAQLRP